MSRFPKYGYECPDCGCEFWVCERCGREVKGSPRPNQRFCSPTCRLQSWRDNGGEPARLCEMCCKAMPAKRADARFCSAACRQRSRRWKAMGLR